MPSSASIDVGISRLGMGTNGSGLASSSFLVWRLLAGLLGAAGALRFFELLKLELASDAHI